MSMTLAPDLIAAIKAAAAADAELFVAEFSAVLDPEETDWDATAWEVSCGDLEIAREERHLAFDIYSATLVSETERLVAARQ